MRYFNIYFQPTYFTENGLKQLTNNVLYFKLILPQIMILSLYKDVWLFFLIKISPKLVFPWQC